MSNYIRLLSIEKADFRVVAGKWPNDPSVIFTVSGVECDGCGFPDITVEFELSVVELENLVEQSK